MPGPAGTYAHMYSCQCLYQYYCKINIADWAQPRYHQYGAHLSPDPFSSSCQSVGSQHKTMNNLGSYVSSVWSTWSTASLVPCLCVPPGEKRPGERSRISWAYYPKVVMTNEIARSVIITYHFPYNSKICSSPFEYL